MVLPPETRKYHSNALEQKWMEGMSMEESIVVVQKMALASGKDAEHVRNFFLRTQPQARKAQEILKTESFDDLKRLVVELGLDTPSDKMVKYGKNYVVSKTIDIWPWMRGTNGEQRDRVIERMKRMTNLTAEECYALLRQPHASNELGRIMYESSDEKLKGIVKALRGYGGSLSRLAHMPGR
ncbi:hypothetical protein CBS101457_000076 [Exobasidium rhododendri]|nr:hypothetical protein CBS101457_000076 [Exobasidium rhododendri]